MKLGFSSDLHMGCTNKTMKYIRRSVKNLVIDNPGIDAMILAGDLASTKVHQTESCFRQIREHWDGDIFAVFGNHDYWNGEALVNNPHYRKHLTFQEIFEAHEEACQKYDVTYLGDDNGPYVNREEDIRIYGFDGWYASTRPDTNDSYWMPKQTPTGQTPHEYMHWRAHQQLFDIFDDMDKQEYCCNILVTHFQPCELDPQAWGHGALARYTEHITPRFDYLLCGHTHNYFWKQIDGCQIINTGSDYNQPKWRIIDV